MILIPAHKGVAQVEWKDGYVTLAENDQSNHSIAKPSNDNHVAIVWVDQRNTTAGEIYMQLLDAHSGLPLWEPDGIPICTVAGSLKNPRAAYDSLGGIIVVWEDYRVNPGVPEIYAQRVLLQGIIDPNWDAAWPDGLPICTGTGWFAQRPRIVSNGEGAFIAWEDYRNTFGPPLYQNKDIYMQYVLATSPTPLWAGNGIRIAINDPGTNNQTTHELVLDNVRQNYGSGSDLFGVSIVYEDDRNLDLLGQSVNNIFADRYDRNGNRVWGDVNLDASPSAQQNPKIASTELQSDGYVIVWEDSRNIQSMIFAAHYDEYANNVWGTGISVCLSNAPQLKPDVLIQETLSTPPYAVVAWQDYRNGNTDIYANLINVRAVAVSFPAGYSICSAINTQENFSMNLKGFSNSNVIIAWQDNRTSVDNDIYYQDISIPIWSMNKPVDGWLVTKAKQFQTKPLVSRDVFVWVDGRRDAIAYDATDDLNIYAQKIGDQCDAPTEMKWKDIYASIHPQSPATNHKMYVDDGGITYLVWQESRPDQSGITPDGFIHGVYIQKLDKDGVPRWKNGGVLVSDPTVAATTPDVCGALASSGQPSRDIGGAYVIWKELEPGGSNTIIKVARVLADQTIAWRLEPLRFGARVPGDSYDPVITPVRWFTPAGAPDQLEGAWFAFINEHLGSKHRFVGKVSPLGKEYFGVEPSWSGNEPHYDPIISTDYQGGCYLLTRGDGLIKAHHFSFWFRHPYPYGGLSIGYQQRPTYFSDNDFPGYDLAVMRRPYLYQERCSYNHDAIITYSDLVNSPFAQIKTTVFYDPNPITSLCATSTYDWNYSFGPTVLTSDPTITVHAKYPAVDYDSTEINVGGSTNERGSLVSWEEEYAPTTFRVMTNRAYWQWDGSAFSWITSGTQWMPPARIANALPRDPKPDIAYISAPNGVGSGIGTTVWLGGEQLCVPSVTDVVFAQSVDYLRSLPIFGIIWPQERVVSKSTDAFNQTSPIIKTGSNSDGVIFWNDSRGGISQIVGSVIYTDAYDIDWRKDNPQRKDDRTADGFFLSQGYPNPSDMHMTIRFDFAIAEDAHVGIKIYDALGRLVTTVNDGMMVPGNYSVQVHPWQVPGMTSGFYLLELSTGQRRVVSPFVLTR